MSSLSARALAAAEKPVSDAAPAGANIRFESDFESLKAEMDKISGLAAAGVDWGRAAVLATDILETRSKDLLVGSYLALALFRQDGYVGLCAGIDVLRLLVDGFWDALFPEPNRMRARVSAVEWFLERAAAEVQNREPALAEAQQPAACVEALAAFDAALSARFGGDAPMVSDLRSALNERAAAAPSAAPAPAPEPATAPASAPPSSAPVTVVAPPSTADLGSGDAIESALKDCLVALRTVATALRRANPRDPAAYRLARVGAWGRVRRPPPDSGGQTRVPAAGISAEAVDRFEGLSARGSFAELLEQAETQFAQSVLWLDLQWYVARALKALGPEYAPARQIVVHETGLLVRSFPSLLDLSFESGFPFASGSARQWIESEALGAGASGAPNASSTDGTGAVAATDGALAAVLVKARELIDEGKADAAFAALQEIVSSAPSRRDRFVRRMALARLLAGAGEQRLAIAQLESAEDEIAAFRLEEWEPRLCAEAFELAFACQRSAAREGRDGAEKTATRLDELLARLARLDAAAALRLRAKHQVS